MLWWNPLFIFHVSLKPAPLLVVLLLIKSPVSYRWVIGDWSLLHSALWSSDLWGTPLCGVTLGVVTLMLLYPVVTFSVRHLWRLEEKENALNNTLISWVFPVLLGWWPCQHHRCGSTFPCCIAGAGCMSLMERDSRARLCNSADIRTYKPA